MKSEERKNWEKEQRKERIIELSEELIFMDGFEESTMENIARASGYNKRTIYLYFRDKEELFYAIVKRGLEKLTQFFLSSVIDSDNGIERLVKLGWAYYEFSTANPGYFDLIMRYESKNRLDYLDIKPDDMAEFKAACQKISDRHSIIVLDAIKTGIKDGTVKIALQPDQILLLLWGVMIGVLQIILMRKRAGKDAFGISCEKLFKVFLENSRAWLSG